MRTFISTLLIIIGSFAACLYFPWWTIAIVAFVVMLLIPQSPWKAWIAGFSAIFLLWFALSYFISSANAHQLAGRVSMMILKMNNPFLLMFITATIGGLVAGFAAITGSLVRRMAK